MTQAQRIAVAIREARKLTACFRALTIALREGWVTLELPADPPAPKVKRRRGKVKP